MPSGSGCARRPARAAPTAASARRRTSRRRRDGRSRRRADVSSNVAERHASLRFGSWPLAASARSSRPPVLDGWMNAIREPCAPARGCSSMSCTPCALSAGERRVDVRRRAGRRGAGPGRASSRNFATGASGVSGSTSSSVASPVSTNRSAMQADVLGLVGREAEQRREHRDATARRPRPRCRRDRAAARRSGAPAPAPAR